MQALSAKAEEEGRGLFAAGPLTAGLWEEVQPIVRQIEGLPFLAELAAGELTPRAFTNYLLQDGLYLRGYARAMALLAARAAERGEAQFWAGASATAIGVEESMHQALLADSRLAPEKAAILGNRREAEAAPTTLGYVSYLVSGAVTRSHAVGVAGVLPCFWVYAHVGKVLVQKAGALAAEHPYRTWIATYDSEDFDALTRRAVGILEKHLAAANMEERRAMAAVFRQACLYELHFWAMAHRLENWELDGGTRQG